MTRDELDYVVGMAERYGREIDSARRHAEELATLAKEMRKELDARVGAIADELNEAELEVERLDERLDEVLNEKEHAIIARDATISAQVKEVKALNAALNEALEKAADECYPASEYP